MKVRYSTLMRLQGGRQGLVVCMVGTFTLAGGIFACSDEGESGPGCGRGTVRVGNECVADMPDGGGAGGTSSGGQPNPGGAGGSVEGGGGASDASAGGAATGGTSSDASTGDATPVEGGQGGADGSGPTGSTGRWLAFQVGASGFVYDTATFPERTAIPMGTGFPEWPARSATWSPDGKRLLYFDTDGLYVRDMTGDTPGAAVFLGSFQRSSSDSWAWSADSASLLYRRGGGGDLFTLDPTDAAAVLNPVSTGVTSSTWAPTSNHLLYADAGGYFVVDVAAGVPGTPKQVLADPATIVVNWLPGAPLVLTLVPIRHNVLIDPRPAEPTTLTLPASPTASLSNFAGIGYPNDAGNLVAWAESGQILYASIGANGVGPTQVGIPATGGPVTTQSWWGNRIVYEVGGQSYWFDLASGSPSAVRNIPLPQVTNGPRRSPNGHVALTISGSAPTRLDSFDLAGAGTEARHLQEEPGPVTSPTFSGDGDWLAYVSGGVLKVVSVSNAPAAPIVTSGSSPGGDTAVVDTLGWSSNGGFIAFTQKLNGISDVVGLVRMNGTVASAPVFVTDRTQEALSFVFQP